MNAVFQAGHLPGLLAQDIVWHDLGASHSALAGVQVPQLTPEQVQTVTATVRQQAALHLRSMSLSDIIERIDRAVLRLLDEEDPARQTLQAWLPRVCGLDADMVRLNLNRYLKTFRAQSLHRFVAEDLPNPKVLDEFQPMVKGGWAMAVGPQQLLHLWSGNVPALPMWSLACGLLAKAGNVGKLASAEPIFASVWAQVLVQVEPRWRDAFALLWWEGGDTVLEAAAVQHADAVIAYGGDDTLQALRQRMPSGVRWLPHGHKLGFGLVTCAALTARHGPELALAAARDVARHDQSGCYSPHVFYVQRGGVVSPREWAERLAHALQQQHARHPRRAPDAAEAQALGQWRQHIEWSANQILYPGAGGDVAFSEQTLALSPGPGLRCVQVVAFDGPTDVLAQVAGARRWLQTVGLACTPEDWFEWARQLGQVGVTRLCALGAMTAPEAGWHHDGSHSLRDFLRWVEVEQSLDTAAEDFAPYSD
jgi:hypothetical protein